MRQQLHAEWTKLRTSPGTVWLLLGIVAATVAVSALGAETCSSGDCAKASLIGVQLGQAIVAILAVLVIGGEYGTGMVRVTLAAMPRDCGVSPWTPSVPSRTGSSPGGWAQRSSSPRHFAERGIFARRKQSLPTCGRRPQRRRLRRPRR